MHLVGPILIRATQSPESLERRPDSGVQSHPERVRRFDRRSLRIALGAVLALCIAARGIALLG
jgi:hypothetical protein